ncbi:hypothetical protein E3N88_18647 [Mikania micrantha]|uniref:Uncharacterized protein n=1 Tax=Mikania micrantha TaxID=192012 RepID=A0A5N6NL03_9ASTR|nr:hypothetical protein E3N88_18647 [Mikania micrantha]
MWITDEQLDACSLRPPPTRRWQSRVIHLLSDRNPSRAAVENQTSDAVISINTPIEATSTGSSLYILLFIFSFTPRFIFPNKSPTFHLLLHTTIKRWQSRVIHLLSDRNPSRVAVEDQTSDAVKSINAPIEATSTVKDQTSGAVKSINTPIEATSTSTVDKDFAKFGDANLDIYETHYAPLFRDCVAIGDETMTPLQFQNTINPNEFHEELNIKGKGINVEVNLDDDEDIFNSFIGSSSGKRNKSREANNRSTKSKTSSFEEKHVVLDELTSKSTQNFALNNPSPTISDCMNIVITFPDFNKGSKNYSLALRVFIKKQNREAFMFPTTNKAKMESLKLLME